MGDLKFDEYGIVVNVRFNTMKSRCLRLVMARNSPDYQELLMRLRMI